MGFEVAKTRVVFVWIQGVAGSGDVMAAQALYFNSTGTVLDL